MENNINTILGVDWGEKRIGLAIGHIETSLAHPLKTVESEEDILDTIKEEDVDMIVIGKPYSISNKDHKLSLGFENFLTSIKKKINIPVMTYDERLSSKAADALVGDKKTKASRDALAAMIILQSYIDSKYERNI